MKTKQNNKADKPYNELKRIKRKREKTKIAAHLDRIRWNSVKKRSTVFLMVNWMCATRTMYVIYCVSHSDWYELFLVILCRYTSSNHSVIGTCTHTHKKGATEREKRYKKIVCVCTWIWFFYCKYLMSKQFSNAYRHLLAFCALLSKSD